MWRVQRAGSGISAVKAIAAIVHAIFFIRARLEPARMTEGSNDMSFQITDAFVNQYSGNLRFLAQQKKSRLRGRVYEEPITGEAAYIDQLAPSTLKKRTTRHADTPLGNAQHLRRRIAPYDFDGAELIDKEDKVRLLIDPTSGYAQNLAAAGNRSMDDEILVSMWSNAYTGHAGSTVIAWPNGNNESQPAAPGGTQVGVADWTYGNGAGNAGLTISKLISAMVALDAAEGGASEDPDSDQEPRYLAIAAKQKGNLLATTEATLKEFGVAKDDLAPLRDGKIAMILGFETIHSERLLVNGAGQTRVPAWRKSAIGLGMVTDLFGRVSERGDKAYSVQAYAGGSWGASRIEEAKQVELVCA